MGCWVNFNLSPQGDENGRVTIPTDLDVVISTYPRKGTKTYYHPFFFVRLNHFNLSPQGDENVLVAWDLTSLLYYFNLSPQGDENIIVNLPPSQKATFQLIPARGRKPQIFRHLYGFIRFQLIPARGRKHLFDQLEASFVLISTYPRKGTETPSSEAWMHNFCKFQLIPARGRKRGVADAAPAPCHFNLSPQGDGNLLSFKKKSLVCISTYPRKGTETFLFCRGRD